MLCVNISNKDNTDRIVKLEEEIRDLKGEIQGLKKEFRAFREESRLSDSELREISKKSEGISGQF